MRPPFGHSIGFRLRCEGCYEWTPSTSGWDWVDAFWCDACYQELLAQEILLNGPLDDPTEG